MKRGGGRKRRLNNALMPRVKIPQKAIPGYKSIPLTLTKTNQ